jgi:hypothetical protein
MSKVSQCPKPRLQCCYRLLIPTEEPREGRVILPEHLHTRAIGLVGSIIASDFHGLPSNVSLHMPIPTEPSRAKFRLTPGGYIQSELPTLHVVG